MLTPLDRAKNDRERRYARAGIPAEFWGVELRKLRFRRCVLGLGKQAESISPDSQRRALKQAVIQPKNQLVVIGSSPTDEGALAASSWVLRELLDREFSIQWINADSTKEYLPSQTAAYCVYNVLHRATDSRVEAVRDLLVRWVQPIRFVAVAACTDPFEFCSSRLGLWPDFCCRVEDPQ